MNSENAKRGAYSLIKAKIRNDCTSGIEPKIIEITHSRKEKLLSSQKKILKILELEPMIDPNKISDASSQWTSQRLVYLLLPSLAIVLFSTTLSPLVVSGVSVLLGLCLVAIATIDASKYIIPDILSLPLIPLGLLFALFQHSEWPVQVVASNHLMAAATGFLILHGLRAFYWKFRGIEALGLGDVKFAAVIGAWVGMTGLIWTLLLASLSALLFTGFQAIKNQQSLELDHIVPFGTFLAPALWIIWYLQTKYGGLIWGLTIL